MYRLTSFFLAGLIVFAACGDSTADTDEPAPSSESVSGDTGLTGVLDEDEFAKLHEMKEEDAPPARGTMIELGDGSQAYLSLPAGEGPRPAVIVIHEWWGLNGHIKHWADRLAADGYAAIAVDLYGGEVATDRENALRLYKAANAAPEKAHATLRAAHDFAVSDARIKAPKTAAIGWCFGGAQSLQAALTLPDLDAAVIYYGRLVTDAERLKVIKAELLGVFGNQDKGIPPATVDTFAAGLEAAGVTHRILRYDANHAFANPSGGRYDKESATAAWAEVAAFLARVLRG